jgi:Protein of unknown function (DUF3037)
MPETASYDYAVIRLVPRVEREEFINVGVILFCRSRRFLETRLKLDQVRALALFPDLDLAEVQQYLELFPKVCKGGKAAGYIGGLSQQERFHWLVAPRSTIIQTSHPHSGLCEEPKLALESLLGKLVI